MSVLDLFPVAVFVAGMVWMKLIDIGQAYYRDWRGVRSQ